MSSNAYLDQKLSPEQRADVLLKDIRKIALIGPHADSPRKFFGGYTLMCMAESTLAVANSIARVEGGIDAPATTVRRVPGTNVQSDEGPEFDAFLHPVRIGASSEDIRAEGSFRITADAWIDGKTRSMVAEAEVEP